MPDTELTEAERDDAAEKGRHGTKKFAHDDSSEYINRELSWVRFNSRVLDEAMDKSKPLLERVKFMSIFSNNLDEFFMIRVSGLIRQLNDGVVNLPPDGMTPVEQLAAIRKALTVDIKRQIDCWHEDILPELTANGIEILEFGALNDKQKKYLDNYFKNEIFPTLTPLAFDPGHPFPHISNLSLNFALALRDGRGNVRFARLKIPESFPRLFLLPADTGDKMEKMGLREGARADRFVWLEDIVEANLGMLFPGMIIEDAVLFRVTRDADFEIESDEAEDLLHSIRESVDRRRFGLAVRLQIEKNTPRHIREILTRNLELDLFQVYSIKYPVGLSALMQLYNEVDRPDLKFPPFTPRISPEFQEGRNVFRAIAGRDILLYHPYDSFMPVVNFIREASRDPDVLAIKQTLYRTGSNSPIVESLKEACSRGKQVAALVELKARFDEENNIGWARALEGAGVHVVYGLPGLKTHAKICLVVRREKGGIRRYVHLGTGNYNAVTARIYTDFGLFTANPEIGADVSDLFNMLTGYSEQREYRKLLVAPNTLRREIIARIDREIERHCQGGGGHLIFKLNAISDRESMDALYRASKAGVKVDLQVRGICCLRPGIENLSENIRVTSIVGRFLEHTRAFYFRNGGDEELYLGSADLMTRNLDRRVECLYPVEDPALRRRIVDVILPVHLRDDAQCSELDSWGEYKQLKPNGQATDSQKWMIDNMGLE
ncbi:MAG: polyphosphate kinase 1 [Synergistaceae bacterium]|jgi:polyphosphate kinase|nr:polyphosphate kinase 1 [Synergistaceae bacterium]